MINIFPKKPAIGGTPAKENKAKTKKKLNKKFDLAIEANSETFFNFKKETLRRITSKIEKIQTNVKI